MEQVTAPFKQFFAFNRKCNKNLYSEKIVRMSELNNSYTSILEQDNNKKMNQMPINSSTPNKSLKKMPSFEEQMNYLDFQTFLKDFTEYHMNATKAIEQSSEQTDVIDKKQILCEKPLITYESNQHKEKIVLDATTNPDNCTVVKIKIAMPKAHNVRVNIVDNNKPNNTDCEKRFSSKNNLRKCHNQPIMGKNALLMSKNNNKSDSEIIHELVIQRFNEHLSNYYERSFQRQSKNAQQHFTNHYENNDAQREFVEVMQESDSTNSLWNSSFNDDDAKSMVTSTMKHTTNESDSIYKTCLQTFTETKEAIKVEGSYNSIQFPSDDEFKAIYDHTSVLSESIGTSNVSTLISTNFPTSFDTNDSKTNSYMNDDLYNIYVNQRLNDLVHENRKNSQMLTQASKALAVCRKTKEFAGSVEEIEAERLLLLSTRRLEGVKTEIENIHHGFWQNKKGCGNVKLLNLTFSLQNYGSNKKKETFTHWYVCVISQKEFVYATEAQQADNNNKVTFSNEIQFNNLDSNFNINLNVYSLRVRNNLKNYSHESKFHLNKTVKQFWLHKLFHHTKASKVDDSLDVNQVSSFTLDAKFTFNLNHLHQANHFKFSYLSLCSLLNDHFQADFETSVSVNEDYCGFLNIGVEAGANFAWNRRWCVICGTKLYFYNYPNEQSPFTQIDLSSALAPVLHADREICPKPRTLLLDLNDVRYFLSADDMECMFAWERKLNVVLDTLKQWKIRSKNV